MSTVRSVIFYLVYGLSLLVHCTLCLTLGWLLPLKKRYRYFVLWNRFVVWWLKISCGVSYQMIGREKIPGGAYVMLSNHQSPWETLFLYCEFQPLCAVLKRELLKIPFFGWALWMLDPIAIDRSKRRTARDSMLTQGVQHLRDGISVLVFPEGTRGEPGEDRKYFTGGAQLAIAAGATVVPVAHNAGLYWPSHRLAKTPGVIKVIIGDPIDATGRDPRELTDQVKTWVENALR